MSYGRERPGTRGAYPYQCLDVRSAYMYPTRVDGELNASCLSEPENSLSETESRLSEPTFRLTLSEPHRVAQ